MLRTVFLFVCGLLLVTLLAAIFWASSDSLWDGLSHMLDNPWAIVSLLDLGLGLLFVAVWICLVEPNRLAAAGWIVGLLLLGNATTLAYLLWRGRRFKRIGELVLARHPSD